MQRFRDLSVTGKLVLLAGLTLSIYLLSMVLAGTSYRSMAGQASQLSKEHLLATHVAGAFEQWTLDDDQSNMYGALVALGDPRLRQLTASTYQEAAQARVAAGRQLATLTAQATDPAERALLARINAALLRYDTFTQRMRQDANSGQARAAVQVMAVENNTVSDELTVLFTQLGQVTDAHVAALQHSIADQSDTGLRQLLTLALLGLLTTLAVAVLVTRAITRPLAEVQAAAQSLSQHCIASLRAGLAAFALGDFEQRAESTTTPPSYHSRDELGRTADAVRTIVADVRNAVIAYEVARAATQRAHLERDRMTADLHTSEAQFRAIFEQAAVGIARLTPDGRWLQVNDRLCAILGYSQQELLQLRFQDITPADDPALQAAANPAWNEGTVQTMVLEKRYVRKGGTLVWVTVVVSQIRDSAGRDLQHIAVVMDSTARKHAEFELRQALEQLQALHRRERDARIEAETAVRVRDQVLSAASHDLRTPLTVIRGGLERIDLRLERGRGIAEDWLAEQVQTLTGAVGRMCATIDEVTDAAQLQAGQPLALREEALDLAEVIQRGTELVAAASCWEGVAPVELTLLQALPTQGDCARLERVVQNIVGNAVKYSPEGTLVQVAAHIEGSWIVLTVRDQGVGIPEDELPNIFTPFYRASTACGIAGTGIGLAGAKLILEQHGGTIAVISAAGAGTTVTIRLPVAHSAWQAAEPGAAAVLG